LASRGAGGHDARAAAWPTTAGAGRPNMPQAVVPTASVSVAICATGRPPLGVLQRRHRQHRHRREQHQRVAHLAQRDEREDDVDHAHARINTRVAA
jgi:hypothetical protein